MWKSSLTTSFKSCLIPSTGPFASLKWAHCCLVKPLWPVLSYDIEYKERAVNATYAREVQVLGTIFSWTENGGMKNIKQKWSYILQNLTNAHMKWKISTTLLSLTSNLGECTWYTSVDLYSCSGFQIFPFYLYNDTLEGWLWVFFFFSPSKLLYQPCFHLFSFSPSIQSQTTYSFRTYFESFPIHHDSEALTFNTNSSPGLLPLISSPELWAIMFSYLFHINLTWKTIPSG